MKKLLIVTALFGFSAVTLAGCGGRKEQVIESATDADSGTADQKNAYEESMKSGAMGSSKTNPPPAPPKQ